MDPCRFAISDRIPETLSLLKSTVHKSIMKITQPVKSVKKLRGCGKVNVLHKIFNSSFTTKSCFPSSFRYKPVKYVNKPTRHPSTFDDYLSKKETLAIKHTDVDYAVLSDSASYFQSVSRILGDFII